MPAEIFTALPQLGALVEKLGVIGLLMAVVAYLVWERMQKMKELRATYRERDRCRMKSERYRNALVAHGHPIPDTADIDLLVQQEG